MPVRYSVLTTLVVLVMTGVASAQERAGSQDHWRPVRALEGVWEGEGTGFGQTSRLTHKWQFVLDGHFFRLETRSDSKSKSGEDEIHEDVGYMSWSESENVLRFRQFLSEGFVNTFRVEQVDTPQPGVDFEPEGTEGMETLSARMTLRFIDADTYKMVLELGTKGGDLKPCQTMTLRKVK